MRATTRTFWVLQIGGWTAFVGALLVPWLRAFPLRWMLWNKLPLVLTGFATSLLLRALYRRLLRREGSIWILFLAALVASYVGSVFWEAASEWLGKRTGAALIEGGGLVGASIGRFDQTLYLAIVLVGWSLLYLGIAHHQALQSERERSLRAEALAQSAQLRALRYQVNPHFLFNTLNAVSTLVAERRNPEAQRMLARLADFLRATLDGTGAEQIPLRDEIALAQRYLDIETIRFGDKLSVRFEIEADAWASSVPNLVLQPILENAVRHGIARNESGGEIAVAARRRGSKLVLSVTDSGSMPAAVEPVLEGIGLSNTRARLAALYGDASRLDCARREGGGFAVTLELPL